MAKLIFDLPGDGDWTVEIRPGEPLTLGRDNDNAVRLADDSVSRRHARLDGREDGTSLIEDLGSVNGTKRNGAPLARSEVLEDGDRLSFGVVTAVYFATEENAARLPAIEPSVGETLAGRYQLESSVGETTEYHNFLAADLATGMPRVSLKVFLPGVIAQAGGFGPIRQAFARFRAVPTHPQLIRLLGFGRWRGCSYLATEWIEGYPLLDVLRRRGELHLPEALRLARQAAAATDHARAHGLPTPDLAPRAALLAFDEPLTVAAWEGMLDAPLEGWPTFTLKLAPRLFEPMAPASALGASSVGVLMCELLGHPPTAPGTLRPSRIASLGEAGNAVLARGLEPACEAFGGDVAFIEALAQAAGVRGG